MIRKEVVIMPTRKPARTHITAARSNPTPRPSSNVGGSKKPTSKRK